MPWATFTRDFHEQRLVQGRSQLGEGSAQGLADTSRLGVGESSGQKTVEVRVKASFDAYTRDEFLDAFGSGPTLLGVATVQLHSEEGELSTFYLIKKAGPHVVTAEYKTLIQVRHPLLTSEGLRAASQAEAFFLVLVNDTQNRRWHHGRMTKSELKNLLTPLFLMGCFPVDFQEGKPLRTKSGKRPIEVGKPPIKEGKPH